MPNRWTASISYLGALIGVEKLNGPVEAAMVRFEKKLRKSASAP